MKEHISRTPAAARCEIHLRKVKIRILSGQKILKSSPITAKPSQLQHPVISSDSLAMCLEYCGDICL